MKDESKDLWLFTMRFPYGLSEPFLENELPYLCERFNTVRIFPMFNEDGEREVPKNAIVERLLEDPYQAAGLIDMLKYIKTWIRTMSYVNRSAPSKKTLKKQRPLIRSRFRQGLKRAITLRNGLMNEYMPQQVVLYSYWNYDWALVLSILKTIDPSVSFVTRMLGFDMFKFRAPDDWPAFRTFQLDMASANYIISKAGMEHMLSHYGEFKGQYHLAYLATLDHGVNPGNSSDRIRIVSCANMVQLKRIDLLVDALKRIKETVRWTHFGDGPEMASIRSAIKLLPETVEVDLRGSTANMDILDWYRNEPVDLFVHTSSTEGGVPVALQEAASFGIPLIGTDVGGIPEIVCDVTGALVPADVTPLLLANTISDQFQRFSNEPGQRAAIRKFWSDRFRAGIVYRQFADHLFNL